MSKFDTSSENIISPKLDESKLSQTWSEPGYEHYIKGKSTWNWHQFPNFNLKNSPVSAPNSLIDGSVLEIGSAAGGAYKFLKESGVLAEDHDYTGMDISDMGINFCLKNYPLLLFLFLNVQLDYKIIQN